MDRRKRLGEFGEEAAAAHLIRSGHRLLARRWRCARGEIDLITRDGRALVFVEVRTRRAGAPGLAEESVGPAKRVRLVDLAYAYLSATGSQEESWRIDVVAVDVDRAGRITRIHHIPNAVEDVS
ncbi:MAG TPA: YraN family protein [Roseiflexaceae bacterium]|nr:YraN family protein [Roseiflexaceae bacterium]